MSKPWYPAEFKIMLVRRYLSGEGSYRSLSTEYGIDNETLRQWTKRYQEQGDAGFYRMEGNAHYSKEFKEKCVGAVLRGEGAVDDIVAKYNISDKCILRNWIMKYNANMPCT